MPKKASAKRAAAATKAVSTTQRKLTLPDGAKVGTAVAVTYDKKQILAVNPNAEEEVSFGSFDGVISKINAHLVSVQFFYGGDEQSEVIELDLDSGMDKKYKVPIAKIEGSKSSAEQLAEGEEKRKGQKSSDKKKGDGKGHRPADDNFEYV